MSQENFLAAPHHQPLEQSVVVVPDGTTCIEFARKVTEQNRQNEDWDESFFVCDVGWILDQYKRWKNELPRVEVYYAVKANSLQPVISTLAALGCGFDCASKNEIAMVLNLGASKDRIIYSHTCKFSSYITFAKEKGVYPMTFDNEEEIHKVKKYFPNARLVVRIRSDDKEARVTFGSKFGATVDYAKILIQKAYDLKMNVVGVSFHVGSGSPGLKSYETAIENARNLFDFAKEIGYNFDLLDIGGGFPATKFDESIYTFEHMANVVRESLDKNFPVGCGVKIIAEPGRFFPGGAYSLVTNVIGKRKITQDSVSYFIGDGIYNSFTHVLLENTSFQPVPLSKPCNKNPVSTTIFGVSCDGGDVVSPMTKVPEVEMNDWLFWSDMGSYSALTRFGFNGFTTHKAYHFITPSALTELKSTCTYPPLLPKIALYCREGYVKTVVPDFSRL